MKALLDTHVFLWWVLDDERLTPYMREYIADEGHNLLLSSASCWEIAIKAKMGRLKLSENPEKFILDQMILNNISGLPIQLVHALHITSVPFLSKFRQGKSKPSTGDPRKYLSRSFPSYPG